MTTFIYALRYGALSDGDAVVVKVGAAGGAALAIAGSVESGGPRTARRIAFAAPGNAAGEGAAEEDAGGQDENDDGDDGDEGAIEDVDLSFAQVLLRLYNHVTVAERCLDVTLDLPTVSRSQGGCATPFRGRNASASVFRQAYFNNAAALIAHINRATPVVDGGGVYAGRYARGRKVRSNPVDTADNKENIALSVYADLLFILPVADELCRSEVELVEGLVRHALGGALDDSSLATQVAARVRPLLATPGKTTTGPGLNYSELIVADADYVEDLRSLWLGGAFDTTSALLAYQPRRNLALTFNDSYCASWETRPLSWRGNSGVTYELLLRMRAPWRRSKLDAWSGKSGSGGDLLPFAAWQSPSATALRGSLFDDEEEDAEKEEKSPARSAAFSRLSLT
jgi:hypothetical protein